MTPVDSPEREKPDADQIAVPVLEVPCVVERRSAPRRKLALIVHLRFPSVDAVVDSETVDISRTGVFLRTTQLRPPGTPARMSITVANRKLVLHGTVVRVVPPPVMATGLGIAFDRPVVDDSGLLEQLLETKWARITGGGDR